MQNDFRPLTVLSAFILAWALITLPPHRLHADLLTQAERQEIIDTYDADLAAFKRLRAGLFRLARQVEARADLFGPKPADDTSLLRPDLRGEMLDLWYPMVDTILNEEHPSLGLPEGAYAHYKYQYLNVRKAGRYAALEAVAKVYAAPSDPLLAQWSAEDRSIILAAGKGPGPKMTFKNGLAMVKRLKDRAWFPVQKGVAEWMGHTKVWRPHRYLIRPAQVDALVGRLEPGDILLERRDWYLTNVGIPGFWTHAALYIGNADQRAALAAHPEVRHWLAAQWATGLDALIKRRYPRAHDGLNTPCDDGRLPSVIEAISPGVTLTSLHHSAACDSLAVLRPRLSKRDRAAAVVRAMRYYRRPYDYDLGSDTSLVCTELVVKSYLSGRSKKGLDLPIERLMGHMITPANAFVRQFDRTFGGRAQQMDLVLFLDGREKDKRAVASDVETFRTTWNRPKWHILVQYAKDMKETVWRR